MALPTVSAAQKLQATASWSITLGKLPLSSHGPVKEKKFSESNELGIQPVQRLLRTMGKAQALEFDVGSAIQMGCDLGEAILMCKFTYRGELMVPTAQCFCEH